VNQSKNYIILQLLCLISVVQLISYQFDNANSNIENRLAGFDFTTPEYVFERDVEKYLHNNNQTSENSDNNTCKDNILELEEEIDDCQRPEIYNHYIFGYAYATNYSIDYKEEYTLQFRPEIIPPPPKA
jgi:hypothetical protein